jgi:hypothetical protein
MALLTRLAPANSTWEGCLLINCVVEVVAPLEGDLDGTCFLVNDVLFFEADDELLTFLSFGNPQLTLSVEHIFLSLCWVESFFLCDEDWGDFELSKEFEQSNALAMGAYIY